MWGRVLISKSYTTRLLCAFLRLSYAEIDLGRAAYWIGFTTADGDAFE